MQNIITVTAPSTARVIVDLNSARESYFRIPPIAILTRKGGGGFLVFESVYTDKIFRELNRIHVEGEEIRGMIWDTVVLTRSSVRALNCYLRNKRPRMPGDGRSRWDWKDWTEKIGLRWAA